VFYCFSHVNFVGNGKCSNQRDSDLRYFTLSEVRLKSIYAPIKNRQAILPTARWADVGTITRFEDFFPISLGLLA